MQMASVNQSAEPISGASEQKILSVSGLTVEFGHGSKVVTAVDDLSFELARNQTLAIVGESGSGKSVTSLALLGLIKHVGGRVVSGEMNFASDVLGQNVNLNSLNETTIQRIRGREIAMIFQEPMTSLNPVYTIGSQIIETLILHFGISHKEARLKAIDLLNLVRLPNAAAMLDNYPHQLSGGMRQRAMIALALSCQPKILIADEPTTALDVTIQAQILHIMRDLQEELETALIFISHDMGVVSQMADNILVMKNSKKVEIDKASKVLSAPQEFYTKSLLAAVPRIGSMKNEPLPKMLPLLTEEGVITNEFVRSVEPDESGLPVISVEQLTTRYDIRGGLLNRVTHHVHAAESISFDIYPGETFAVVGESGSGKSTLGKTIQQLIEPTEGAIKFRGQDIFSLPSSERTKFRKEIQYVFQDPYGSLNPRKTVGESIIEPALTHKLIQKHEIKDRVTDLLVKVGLHPDHADRYPHEFSGGQRQRICIARALACNPSLIIADEAVSALDVTVQAQVLNLFMKLQREQGLAYLFITHDMAVVERISHRVAVMYLGQIVEMGTRKQIFENPQHPYTKKLLAAVPEVKINKTSDFQLLEGEVPSPIRAVGDEPKINELVEIEKGHFVARNQ
ncbi:ABC transporter ATP-binding protein [Parasalinivibrio latis]|uniref:ABC transporter ATP-binding protein n=1 Tax=Parasalinivibrio latis TaxID=2952610 RepID=UPI0030E162C8